MCNDRLSEGLVVSLDKVEVIMKKLLLSALISAHLMGCGASGPETGPTGPQPEDYGWKVAETTPLGIGYRSDRDGVVWKIDLNLIDQMYHQTMGCAGTWIDPANVIVISTDTDINWGVTGVSEGYTIFAQDGRFMVLVNLKYPQETPDALIHEFIHVTTSSGTHSEEVWRRCDTGSFSSSD
jgi:hypothetical protein